MSGAHRDGKRVLRKNHTLIVSDRRHELFSNCESRQILSLLLECPSLCKCRLPFGLFEVRRELRIRFIVVVVDCSALYSTLASPSEQGFFEKHVTNLHRALAHP